MNLVVSQQPQEGLVLREPRQRKALVLRRIACPISHPHRSLTVSEFQGERRIDACDATVGDERHAIAESLGKQHIVCSEEHGASCCTLGANQVHHAPAVARVKTAGGLIEKEQLRIAQEAPRKREPALHSPGILCDCLVSDEQLRLDIGASHSPLRRLPQ